MTRVAFLSPLPPARTGVAHYASLLLPGLRRTLDITAFDQQAMGGYDPSKFDLAIYQLGNNPQHEFVYREAVRRPGLAVLHDVVLHHLIVEMTLARGDEEAYVAAMRASHGQMGAAWARARAIGLHDELANFLMPASIDVANRSLAVIVHNAYAAARLRDLGVTTPIHVVAHPYERQGTHYDRDAVRRRIGIAPTDRVIGFFGFLTSAKRAETVLEAFQMARHANPHLKLLIVGEPAPNVDVERLRGDAVIITGYVDDDQFGAYYAAADRLVNLRYPSAGESSGTLVRAFEAGKPVAVSDYAQFAEFPEPCVAKIALGPDEASRLAEFFLREIDDGAVAAAQQTWLEENATLEIAVSGYMDAVRSALESRVPSIDQENGKRRRGAALHGAPMALFPGLVIARMTRRADELMVVLRNDGDATIRAAEYGQPGYRAVLKVFEEGRELQDRWFALPRDLAPGEEASVTLHLAAAAETTASRRRLRLYHALESVPVVAELPASEVEIPLVR